MEIFGQDKGSGSAAAAAEIKFRAVLAASVAGDGAPFFEYGGVIPDLKKLALAYVPGLPGGEAAH